MRSRLRPAAAHARQHKRSRSGSQRSEVGENQSRKGPDESRTVDVEVDPELVELFRGYRAKAKGSFVIESSNDARPDATYDHYRCQSCFEKLAEWLREKGVKSRTPLHTLRKEFGSQICDREGIYAASRALRHTDITALCGQEEASVFRAGSSTRRRT